VSREIELTRRKFFRKARDVAGLFLVGRILGCANVSIPGAPHIYIPDTGDISDLINGVFDSDPNGVVGVRVKAKQSCFISYNFPDSVMNNLTNELRLGDFYSEIGACIPFIQFTGLEKLSPYYVEDANLVMRLSGRQGAGLIESIVQGLGGNWNERTLTWNNSSDIPNAGFVSRKYEHSESSSGKEILWNLQAVQYNEKVKLIQRWIDEPENNYGLALLPVSPSTTFRIFNNSPTLEISLRKQI